LQDGGINLLPQQLTYQASDAISGSNADLVADIGTLQKDNVQVVVVDAVPGSSMVLRDRAAFGYSEVDHLLGGFRPVVGAERQRSVGDHDDYFPSHRHR